jgi:hypothetical protein
MGWSPTAMAAGHQHVTHQIRRDVARRVGGLLSSGPEAEDGAAEAHLRQELRRKTKRRVGLVEPVPAFPLVSVAEDRGFEPLRAINPTRFPSERHRPLGESSAEECTGRAWAGRNPPVLVPRGGLT